MKKILPILLSTVLLSGFFSCGKEVPETGTQKETREGPSQAVTETEDLPPVEPPEYQQGIITFFSGDVYILHEQEEFFAEIGDLVEKEDVLIVEAASYCEVQFGEAAVVRIEENTEVAMNDISLSPGETDVNLDMKSGSVLCKVKKLAGAEEFKVRTQTAVCGVRGTEFSVSADEEKETVLAVREGSVAVLPASVDIDRLKEQAGEAHEDVAAILADLEQSAPVVSANEEINLDEKTLKETEEAVRRVEKAVTEIVEEAKQQKKIDPVKLASLTKAVEDTKKEVAEKVSSPRQVSLTTRDKLEKIDDLTMIDIAPVSAAEEEEEAPGEEKPGKPELVKVAVQVEPAAALITVNGKEAGRGSFSGIYPAGTELTIYISGPGHQDHTLEFTASKETGKLYKVKLVQSVSKEETSGQQEPGGSGDAAAGKAAAGDSAAAAAPGAEPAAGGEGRDTAAVVAAGETPMGDVEIVVRPKDAAILLGGSQVGTGIYRGRHKAGETLTFTAERRGYAQVKIEVEVAEEGTSRTVALQLLPVEVDAAVTGSSVVGNLAVYGDRIIGADGSGSVFAVNPAGQVVWRVDTENNPNENSSPILIGGNIYFSGSKELAVIEAAAGTVVQRIALDGSSAHLFGRRVTEMDGTVYFPANNGVKVLDAGKGAFGREIPVPKGSRMTPAKWKGRLVIANLEGSLIILDPGAKNPVTAAISTAAVQPIAIAPTIHGDLAVFSGRKGTMVCVDLASEKILWEKKLPDNVSVFTDIACSGKGLYAYAKGRIFALSLEDGSPLFASIENATSPPLCTGGRLYYGAGENLVYRSAENGAVLGKISVTGPIVTRPAAVGKKIAAGTSTGHILIMNP